MDKFKGMEAMGDNVEAQIGETRDFDELYAVLDRRMTLVSTQGTYSALTLKGLIDEARKAVDHMGDDTSVDLGVIKKITRTAGLRNKVVDLLIAGTSRNNGLVLAALKAK